MSVRVPSTVYSASMISSSVWEDGYLLDRMNALRKALSMMRNHSNDTYLPNAMIHDAMHDASLAIIV